MNVDAITKLLGVKPVVSLDAGGAEHIQFEYAGPTLRYSIYITPSMRQVAVSADPISPFSAESLYEIYVFFDTIVTCSEEDAAFLREHHGWTDAVYFYEKVVGAEDVQKLSIAVRRDKELRVWLESTL